MVRVANSVIMLLMLMYRWPKYNDSGPQMLHHPGPSCPPALQACPMFFWHCNIDKQTIICSHSQHQTYSFLPSSGLSVPIAQRVMKGWTQAYQECCPEERGAAGPQSHSHAESHAQCLRRTLSSFFVTRVPNWWSVSHPHPQPQLHAQNETSRAITLSAPACLRWKISFYSGECGRSQTLHPLPISKMSIYTNNTPYLCRQQ